jgi:Peptidase family M1 domain
LSPARSEPLAIDRSLLFPSFVILLFLSTVVFGCPSILASTLTVQHDLHVGLFPESQRLVGYDRITLEPVRKQLVVELPPKVEIHTLTVEGRPHPIRRRGPEVIVDHAFVAASGGDRMTIEIRYEAVFDDPVPDLPVNTDNPGFGVTGVISEKGSFLQAGAGWYPQIPGSRATFAVEIDGPSGTVGVTAGRSLGIETRGGRTFSRWEVRQPVESLALSAGGYVVHEKAVGKVTAATYLLPDTVALSGPYLEAIARYLALYDGLFGPYPFEKFAVVENFFPTGYGFPSYTLLGGTVIRLPFIIHTSLGHEIAHCWWGNGVQVDMGQGNWCEGLTTYVADYLYKERQSESEAREYREQMLRNYATLVPPDKDFALNRFVSRTDPVTKAVGYDKAAMIFHMVRRLVGDDAFWQALKQVYRERLFKKTSWRDFQEAFEQTGGRSLEGFFKQWVERPGAPRLALEGVERLWDRKGWVVEGRLSQKRPYFYLQVALEVQLGKEAHRPTPLSVSGDRTAFRIPCESRPSAVVADPDFDCFRRLQSSEIPAAVNSLKASSALLVLVPPGEPELQSAASLLPLSFGIDDFKVASEENVSERDLGKGDILLIGLPKNRKLLSRLPSELAVGDGWFDLNGKRYEDPGDALFAVFAHPWSEGHHVGLFYPLSGGAASEAERKITHYGKYSYLAFKGGESQDKGIWPVQDSPMIYRWNP